LSHLHIDDVYNRSAVEMIQVELAIKLDSAIDQIHASFTYRDSTSLRRYMRGIDAAFKAPAPRARGREL